MRVVTAKWWLLNGRGMRSRVSCEMAIADSLGLTSYLVLPRTGSHTFRLRAYAGDLQLPLFVRYLHADTNLSVTAASLKRKRTVSMNSLEVPLICITLIEVLRLVEGTINFNTDVFMRSGRMCRHRRF